MNRFELGAVVATPRALALLARQEVDLGNLLACHHAGEWGDPDAHDRRENQLSLRHGWRIVSSYPVGEGKVWIITETDRSVTTILLPEEY